jgi:hypothetical protein
MSIFFFSRLDFGRERDAGFLRATQGADSAQPIRD